MKQLIFFGGLLFLSCATSQRIMEVNPSTYASSITSDELKEHLYIYASDEFMGREAGTEGETIAINYLKDQYKALDIKGGMPDGAYFMPMNLNAPRENKNNQC